MAVQRVVIDGDIEIDATPQEQHKSSGKVTDHPVEEGSDITDHFREENDQLTLNCVMTNTPSEVDRSRARVGEQGLEAGKPGFANETWARIRQLLTDRKLVTIETTLKSYKNMALISLDTPRDSKTGDGVQFSCGFRQVRIVRTEMVRLELATRPSKLPQKPKKKLNQGKQPVEEVDGTGAKTITDWLGFTKKGSGLLQSQPIIGD